MPFAEREIAPDAPPGLANAGAGSEARKVTDGKGRCDFPGVLFFITTTEPRPIPIVTTTTIKIAFPTGTAWGFSDGSFIGKMLIGHVTRLHDTASRRLG